MKKLFFVYCLLLVAGISTKIYAQCNNASAFGSGTAPTGGATVTLSTCVFAGEYSTLSGAVAGNTYRVTSSIATDFITVRQGTPAGPVVASGVQPLNFTAAAGGTYYIHVNTNAACGTASACRTINVQHIVCVAPPTSVSATPATICAGSSSNLRAVSAGNTIRWYTVASGGTNIGTSASGANFAVTPATTTTYYAEAWTGSCASTRVAVTVNVTATPAAPTNVTATPNTICPGASVNLNATAGSGTGVVNGFTGAYAPANWSITHTPVTDMGSVNTGSAPTSISVTSSDAGNIGNHSVFYTITVPASGNITFNWSYVTTDVDGPAFDIPQYAINGVIIGNICGFDPLGLDIQSGGPCTIAVTAGQTFSFVMTATDDILGPATVTISNFSGPAAAAATINWYTVASGGTSIGSSASGANFAVTPATTTTYYAEAVSSPCVSATRTPVTVTVNTNSTAPTIATLTGTYCPNTNITLTAAGGTAGTGSNIYWYSGPNGTGTLLGTGASVVVAPSSNMTVYARRQGTCNTTADDSEPITLKTYIYATNGMSTNTYCTDNAGWHHFFSGNNIIFSVRGNLSGAPVNFPVATIYLNGTYYQQHQGPALSTTCSSGGNPGEERFEMARSWNLNFGGGAPSGTYDIRFYYQPAERTAIETAATNWMSTYPACNYSYKYATPLGFYWFKNAGSNYTAPLYDATHYSATGGTTSNGVNYAQWTGIPNFSGGSGAVIIVPTVLLPVNWQYFTGNTVGLVNKLQWATGAEENTDRFEVQRSRDGIVFETIGTVAAAGNSSNTTHYTFDDNNPFDGLNYYRLRLLDKDASEHLSEVVVLNIAAEGQTYVFFPNPTDEVINYQFSSDVLETAQIEILDVLGRVLYRKEKQVLVGANNLRLDIGNLPSGNYLIRATHTISNIVRTEKITVK